MYQKGEIEEHEDDLSGNESESEVLQHSRITRSGKRTASDTDQDEVMNENESDSSSNGEPEPPIKKRIARKRKNQANKCQRKGKNTRKAKHKSKPTETKKWVDGFLDYDEEDSKFKGDSTLPDDVKSLETVLDTFHFLLPKEVIEQIVYHTSLYSTQMNPAQPAKVTTSEMETFLAMVMYMSIIKLPGTRMYRNKRFGIPKVSELMTVNRFEEIKRFLHLNDNTKYVEKGQPGHDKLHKVRPLIDALNCQLAKIPVEENVSVDEQIVPFKGRHSLKQYNPRKPHKWGYKVFVMSGVSAFSYNFEVSTGAGDNVCLPNEPDIGSSSNVVVRLARRLPSDINHKLNIDNWFNSLPLQVYLKERGILSLGTVRENRLQGCPLPSEKEMKKTGCGTYVEKVRRDKRVDLSCVSWYDNKQVNLLSSFAGSQPVG